MNYQLRNSGDKENTETNNYIIEQNRDHNAVQKHGAVSTTEVSPPHFLSAKIQYSQNLG